MDNFVDERDYKILENNKYTFFVLSRIMGGELDQSDWNSYRFAILYQQDPGINYFPKKAKKTDFQSVFFYATAQTGFLERYR